MVGEPRVGVASSPDGSLGSWTSSLAYDAAPRTISASFESAGVDKAGNVFVAFAETAHGYPSFGQASIRYVWSRSGGTAWSAPVTVTAGAPIGTYDPTLVTTGIGRLAIAYFLGKPATPQPSWTLRLATVKGATSAHPVVTHTVIDDRIAYRDSADSMGGSCSGSGPLAGLQNGFVCNRANDDFGLALDKHCRLVVVYPMVATKAGTWVATQRSAAPCSAL